jgi:hypothetical protein
MVKHGWTLCDTLFLSLCKFWIKLRWWDFMMMMMMMAWDNAKLRLHHHSMLTAMPFHPISVCFCQGNLSHNTSRSHTWEWRNALAVRHKSRQNKSCWHLLPPIHWGIWSIHTLMWAKFRSQKSGWSNNVKYLQKNYASVGSVDELSNAKPNITNSTSTIKWCVWGSLNSTRLNPT